MKHKTVKSFLKCAKTILVKKGWCQGEYAQNRHGDSRDVTDRSAAKFCMVGALKRCDGDGLSPMYFAARKVLTAQVPSGGSITGFNDAHGRKKAEVLAIFDDAIKASIA